MKRLKEKGWNKICHTNVNPPKKKIPYGNIITSQSLS